MYDEIFIFSRLTYLKDELTKNWLLKNQDPVFGFPSLVRFSWGPAKKLIKENAVEMEW